jgi:hypothetical protein
MCYGDIDYGRDGYYRAWAEDMYRQEERRQEENEPPELLSQEAA